MKRTKTKIDLNDPKILAEEIARLLNEKKGIDVTVVDLMGKTIVADYFVIASATSSTGVKALSEHVEESLEKQGIFATHADRDAKWVAIDFSSVIVHVFYDEIRDFYAIERLWADGTNIKKYIDKE